MEQDQEYERRLQKAKALVDNNDGKPISIKELSRKVLLNEKKLKKGFKQLFGNSVYAYQLGKRMEMACKLLYYTDRTVESIAETVGYATFSSFCKKFKEIYQMTPLQYRNKD